MGKLNEIFVAINETDYIKTGIGYCSIALFKAGIGAVEEYKGLVEIGKKHIEKFEKEYRSTARSENYVGN